MVHRNPHSQRHKRLTHPIGLEGTGIRTADNSGNWDSRRRSAAGPCRCTFLRPGVTRPLNRTFHRRPLASSFDWDPPTATQARRRLPFVVVLWQLQMSQPAGASTWFHRRPRDLCFGGSHTARPRDRSPVEPHGGNQTTAARETGLQPSRWPLAGRCWTHCGPGPQDRRLAVPMASLSPSLDTA